MATKFRNVALKITSKLKVAQAGHKILSCWGVWGGCCGKQMAIQNTAAVPKQANWHDYAVEALEKIIHAVPVQRQMFYLLHTPDSPLANFDLIKVFNTSATQ